MAGEDTDVSWFAAFALGDMDIKVVPLGAHVAYREGPQFVPARAARATERHEIRVDLRAEMGVKRHRLAAADDGRASALWNRDVLSDLTGGYRSEGWRQCQRR